jgi:hypothetical protein
MIINFCKLIAFAPWSVEIGQVRLGTGGGGTIFNLITYHDSRMAADELKDRKMNYAGGFRLSGVIEVTSKNLLSSYEVDKPLYPVKSLFRARINELAVAEFVFMFSQTVMASQNFYIICTGAGAYELRTEPFVIVGKERVDVMVEKEAGTLTTLKATLRPGRPSTETALLKNTIYTCTFWVIPKEGENIWKFMTLDGSQYPTNTNDAITTGFSPLEQMDLQVMVPTGRIPPATTIKVQLNVNARTAVVWEWLIIAPPAVMFPPTGCGRLCIPGPPLGSTTRRTVRWATPTGEPVIATEAIILLIQTPEKTPLGVDKQWYVEARGADTSITTGWGESQGFDVQDMLDSMVHYPGVLNIQSAEISISFTLQADAGEEIELQPPTGFVLSCSREGSLKQGNLPPENTPPDCIDPVCQGGKCGDQPLKLKLKTVLSKGSYSFSVVVDLPSIKPDPNTFNIIIRDRDNSIVDAAYALPGVELTDVPVALSPELSWSAAAQSQVSDITMTMSFTKAYTGVKAMTLQWPTTPGNGGQTFYHAINRADQVQNINAAFPVSQDATRSSWSEWYKDKSFVKIFVSSTVPIPPGHYGWSFPVQVPYDKMPANNVWYLTLCSSEACEYANGPGSIVSFPMQGFVMNEISEARLKVLASGAKRCAWCQGIALDGLILSFTIVVASISML